MCGLQATHSYCHGKGPIMVGLHIGSGGTISWRAIGILWSGGEDGRKRLRLWRSCDLRRLDRWEIVIGSWCKAFLMMLWWCGAVSTWRWGPVWDRWDHSCHVARLVYVRDLLADFGDCGGTELLLLRLGLDAACLAVVLVHVFFSVHGDGEVRGGDALRLRLGRGRQRLQRRRRHGAWGRHGAEGLRNSSMRSMAASETIEYNQSAFPVDGLAPSTHWPLGDSK